MPCHVPRQIGAFPAVVGDQRPCRQRSQGAAHPSRARQRQQQRMHPGRGGQPYEGDHERDEEQPGRKRLETAKPPHGVSRAGDHRTAIIGIHPDRPCLDAGPHGVPVGQLHLQPDLNRPRGTRHGRRSGSAACSQLPSPVRPPPSANSRPIGRTGAAPSRDWQLLAGRRIGARQQGLCVRSCDREGSRGTPRPALEIREDRRSRLTAPLSRSSNAPARPRRRIKSSRTSRLTVRDADDAALPEQTGGGQLLAGRRIRTDEQTPRTSVLATEQGRCADRRCAVTPTSLCWFSRLRKSCPTTTSDSATVREGCASRTTGGCRRKREKSLRAASLWMLAEEPDLDPARVPEATGAPIRRHRRRDRNRLDGVGDQPSPSR